jgi:hypothetical protein
MGEPSWQFDVADYAHTQAILFASPASAMRGAGLHRLYVGAALQHPLGSRATLYCLQEALRQ